MPADQATIAKFLFNACPDHHVRDGSSHMAVRHTAGQILRRHPEIARASLFTAVVCGDIAEVERLLAADPGAAARPGGPKGSRPAQGSHFVLEPSPVETPAWTPLHYLCFARLDHAPTNEQAVAIARALIDAGADPNAYFMAGGSQYTPLVGVVGAGEEGRASHPQRVALARALLDGGANPFDGQVIYNIRFTTDQRWFLELAYDASVRRGLGDAWNDPQWSMIGMGNYGGGARWLLGDAVRQHNVDVVSWMLEHGASPEPAPASDARMQTPEGLWGLAMSLGYTDVAGLLARHGAPVSPRPPDDEGAFIAACLRGDNAATGAMAAAHPDYLRSPRVARSVIKIDAVEAVDRLLDLGMPIELENAQKQRPLHIAAWSDARRVAARLIDRGAAVDPRETEWGNTPFDFAVHAHHEAMFDVLSPHSRDIWNLVFTGKGDRVRAVLEAEPGLAKVQWNGATPLTWLPCDEAKALEIIALFVAHGADVTPRHDGATAEEIARQRWMFDAADALARARLR